MEPDGEKIKESGVTIGFELRGRGYRQVLESEEVTTNNFYSSLTDKGLEEIR